MNPLAVASALCALALPALAADGRTPIWESTTITEPGAYTLARDLVADGSAAAITIAASGVDLDLAGHTISGTGLGTAITVLDVDDLRIHDGVFHGLVDGIWASQSAGVVIERIRCFDNVRCMLLGGFGPVVVRDCDLSSSLISLYLISAEPAIVERNILAGVNNGTQPLRLLTSNALRVADNASVLVSNYWALLTTGEAVRVGSNRVFKPGGDTALWFDGPATVVEENAVSQGSVRATQDDVAFRENVLRANPDTLAELSLAGARALLAGNIVSGATGLGLALESTASRAVLRGNVARGNATDLSDLGTNDTSAGDNFVPFLF